MSPHQNASPIDTPNGILRALPCVTTVYESQSAVVCRLHPYLHYHLVVLVYLLEEAEHLVVKAVGARGNHEPHHIGHCQSLVVERTQSRDRSVGTCKTLEIGNILHVAVFARVELLRVKQLLRHTVVAKAKCRRERRIVTINAASHAQLAITVWT